MCCASAQCDVHGTCSAHVPEIVSGLSFCVVCLAKFAMVRVLSPTESMPFASMQLALRENWTSSRQETLVLCGRPRHRHSRCLESLYLSKSFLSLLSGIVLACVGLQNCGERWSWNCHGQSACQFLQTIGEAPVSSSLSEALIRDCQFDRCSQLLDLQSYTLLQWRKHHDDASSFLPFERRVSPTSVKRRPFSPT